MEMSWDRLRFLIRSAYDTPSCSNQYLSYGSDDNCQYWSASNPSLQHILFSPKAALAHGRHRWCCDQVPQKLAEIQESSRLGATKDHPPTTQRLIHVAQVCGEQNVIWRDMSVLTPVRRKANSQFPHTASVLQYDRKSLSFLSIIAFLQYALQHNTGASWKPTLLHCAPDTCWIYFQVPLLPVRISPHISHLPKHDIKHTQHPINLKMQNNAQTFDCK